MSGGTGVLNEASMAREFSPKVWQTGGEILESGKIVASASVGEYVEADVLGSSGERYRVRVLFDGQGLRSSRCACPSRKRCKHAAAVVRAWILDRLDAGNMAGQGEPDKGRDSNR